MTVNNEGPEGKNVLAELHENEIETLFSNFFKWKLVYKNIDIKFSEIADKDEENRGIDFLYHLYEPFSSNSSYHGVIVESKSVKNTSIFNISRLTTDIKTLKHKILRSQKSKALHDDTKIRQYDIDIFKYGILCYRFRDFDIEKYKKELQKYTFIENKKGENFPTIFVLTNDRISAFAELTKKFTDIEYYYPNYKDHRATEYREKLSLFYAFSDIIPFRGLLKNQHVNCLLTFDSATSGSFQLLEDFAAAFNYPVDYIVLVGEDFSKKSIHERYLSEWNDRINASINEKSSEKEIKLMYLNKNMDCGEDLGGLF